MRRAELAGKNVRILLNQDLSLTVLGLESGGQYFFAYSHVEKEFCATDDVVVPFSQ